MRVVHVALRGFKGIEARMRWGTTNVLFGPNDAGKTNILEAVASGFGAPDLIRPTPRRSRQRRPELQVLIELAGAADDQLLRALLLTNDVPPFFPSKRERQ